MGAQDLASVLTSGLSQTGRLVKLDTPLGNDILVPQRVIGHSRIGRDYRFIIDAVSVNDGIELKALIAQPLTLWLQQSDQTYAAHHGYVHTVRRLGADGGLTSYQLEFASWMHFLRFRKDARIWQNKSADTILTDVFNAHPQAQGAFRFMIRNAMPQRSFCVQYEDDWNFCQRIMESEGLFSYVEQDLGGKSHVVVITDNIDNLPEASQGKVNFYRSGVNSEAEALVQWGSVRTLQSVTLSTRTFDYKFPSTVANPKGTTVPSLNTHGNRPQQTEVYEYTGSYSYGDQTRGDALSEIRMEEWESRAKRFEGAGAVRSLDAGRWFELDAHPQHDAEGTQNRQFAIIEANWFIENNLPVSVTQGQPFPGSLQGELDSTKARYQGEANILTVKHDDGSEGFLLITVEAQRRLVPFRSFFEHKKPEMQMQTAIVVGPSGEEVYTDALNRIKVRFHWDRLNSGDENASCWVRVAMSDTGGRYGSVHVPRVGEEVIVSWLDGDCDRPIVTGRIYNGSISPEWHSNGILSGYKSKEYGGSGYNQIVMDDATGQNRMQLYSSSANAQLHLGYLVAQAANSRGAYLGSGFDLKSDAFGAINAARGLYIGTHQKSLTSQQLDINEARTQLSGAQSTIEALSQASEMHRAESLKDGSTALGTFAEVIQSPAQGASASGGNTAGGGLGSANAFSQPVMVVASPSGIALSTQQSVHIAADRQLNLVSGQSTHVATGKSFVASVAQRLSLFAQGAGMKLFAGKGKVEVQAHDDNIEVTAQKGIKLVSATEAIEAAAKQEILLASGGAYIRIKDGNIEIHAPGNIDIKGSQHSFNGPAHLSESVPTLPGSSGNYDQAFIAHWSGTDVPVANAPYQMFSGGKLIAEGVTNAAGETGLTQSHVPQDVIVKFLEKSNG